MAKARKTHTNQGHQSTSFFSSLSPTKQDMLCIGFLYVITLVLFRGIIFDNAAFSEGGDTATGLIYGHTGNQIKDAEGVDVLWMPYFFSGMPTFGNVAYAPHDVSYLQRFAVKTLTLLYLNAKWGWIIVHYLLGGIFMFFLMRVWKFSRAVALFAAITFMLSPNAIGLAQEGHGSKLMALMYLPVVFLLTHALFEKRNLLNFGLLSAAVGTLMLTNHMQIVYYTFMVIGLYLLYNIVVDFKDNKLLTIKKAALFAGALLIGIGISSYVYLSVYEYATFSIRGGGTAGSTGGLAYDYATNWSWNPWETVIYLIPSFFGFSSAYPSTWQGQSNVPLPLYWGTMPFHTSTEYIGIVPIVLAVIALSYKRNRATIFFATLTLLIFLTSFGKHFSLVYDALFNYLPFFNKFRIPSMILHLIPFTVGMLAAYGITFLLEARDASVTQKLRKTLLYVSGGLVSLMIIGFLFKSSIYETLSGSWFLKDGEPYNTQVVAAFKPRRFDLLWKDYVKFVLIFSASAAAIIAFLNRKIQATAFSATLIAILLVDLVIVDVTFINPKPAQKLEENFQPDATVMYLKQQPGLFRVFPIGSDLFMDNTFAYHGISSIGGYFPAKLKIYQTMLDSCMYKSLDQSFPINMNMVNMLNVRYLIADGQLPEGRFTLVNSDQARRRLTYMNPTALPRVFFVKKAIVAGNQTQVFNELNSVLFNAATSAVVEKQLPPEVTTPDSTSAEVTEFKSRNIVIKAFSSSPALLVLSEVYYPAGWKAYVDGNETEIFKTNYILRSIVVPAGSHEITFKYDPPLYNLGWNLTRIAWGVAVLCILVGLWKTPSIRARFGGRKPEQARTSQG